MQGDEHTATDAATVTPLGGDSSRAVYRDLLRFGPRSRSELSQRLGLSAPTVTRVSRDLLERDLLHTLTAVPRTKGRPHEPLDIEENRGPRFIGVKVTADEVHAVVTTVRANVLEELVLPLSSTAPRRCWRPSCWPPRRSSPRTRTWSASGWGWAAWSPSGAP